jgi:hypothetical protein
MGIKICFRYCCYQFPEGKRPLGRPRRRWEDNIKMNLREEWMGRTEFGWLRIGFVGGLV